MTSSTIFKLIFYSLQTNKQTNNNSLGNENEKKNCKIVKLKISNFKRKKKRT